MAIELLVVDFSGRLVRTLVNGVREAGAYRVAWDGTDRVGRRVAPGVYFARLRSGRFSTGQRLVVLR